MGPFDAIAFVALCVGLVKIFTGPVAKALADRVRGRTGAEPDPALLAEMDQLRERLAEVEERLDFAERLLARGGQPDQIPGGIAPMITKDDIQSFLDRFEGGSLTVMEIEPNLWLARTTDDAEVVVHYAPPVVILRVRVMELPASEPRRSELFRQLLEYNARELVHGSYGLEGDHVVLTDTLELENLDFSEFEASFDSMTLALASHLGALAPYRER